MYEKIFTASSFRFDAELSWNQVRSRYHDTDTAVSHVSYSKNVKYRSYASCLPRLCLIIHHGKVTQTQKEKRRTHVKM